MPAYGYVMYVRRLGLAADSLRKIGPYQRYLASAAELIDEMDENEEKPRTRRDARVDQSQPHREHEG